MQAIGFAPYRFRLAAYVIAGTLCGLAGFLLGNQAEFVSPAYMHWQRSGELIVMVLLGGTGALYGPVLGALALLVLEEALSRLTEHWKAILGPLLVLVVLFAKGGIAGAIETWRRRSMTPAQLLAELEGRAQAAMLRTRHLTREAGAAVRPYARAAATGIRALWRQWEAALRPRLAGFAALAARGTAALAARAEASLGAVLRLLKSVAGAVERSLAVGLGRCTRFWHLNLRPRFHRLELLSRRGIPAARDRWSPWRRR
jgi:hypothetical protein